MTRGKRLSTLFLPAFLLSLLVAVPAFGAVGCDLNDPDRDVARLFPDSSGYRTYYASIDKRGGEPLLRKVEMRLGDRFHGIYETIDVPYTIYEVTSGKKKVGYIHGVNQKGQFGGIQVFVALDLEGQDQGLLHPEDDRPVGQEIAGCRVRQAVHRADAQGFRYLRSGDAARARARVAEIRNPAPEAETDFYGCCGR